MNSRFTVLDSFRGLCAIAVVCFHIRVSSGFSEVSFFRNSSIFVDFFFILSGFVLTHGYGRKSDLNFKKFFVARFFRLYPLHLVMLIAVLFIELFKYYLFVKKGWVFNFQPFSGKTSLEQLPANVLLIHAWLPTLEPLSFNFPSWSISIEFYLYLIFFTTLRLPSKIKNAFWLLILSLALFALYSSVTFFTLNSLRGLVGFFGGSMLYLLYDKIKCYKFSYKAGSTIEIVTLLSVLTFVSNVDSFGYVISVASFFVCVLVFSFEKGFISNFLSKKPFEVIGHLSYSIYMIHVTVIFFTTYILMAIQNKFDIQLTKTLGGIRYLDFGGATENSIAVIIVISIVIFVSKFTYKYIEIVGQSLGKKINAKY